MQPPTELAKWTRKGSTKAGCFGAHPVLQNLPSVSVFVAAAENRIFRGLICPC